jgi:hypothetical protein
MLPVHMLIRRNLIQEYACNHEISYWSTAAWPGRPKVSVEEYQYAGKEEDEVPKLVMKS